MKIKYFVDYPNKVVARGTTEKGNVFVGIARCHPQDKFDISLGKKFARLRAQQKQLKAMEKRVDRQIGFLSEELDIIMVQLNQKQKRMSKIRQQQQKISKELEESNS